MRFGRACYPDAYLARFDAGFFLFGFGGSSTSSSRSPGSRRAYAVGVKDFGDAIPGMGGVLDVLDSPLLAAPVAWFFWTRLA